MRGFINVFARLGVCILLLGFASSTVFAKTIIVNQSGDDSTNLGTLRNAINNLADPGDVIDIQTNRIRLTEPLDIPTHLAGLTINGNRVRISAVRNANGLIWVQASGVSINQVVLRDVGLFVQSLNFQPELAGFSLTNSRIRGEADLTINNVRDCRIEDNRIFSSIDTGISTLFTTDCVIRRNQVRGEGLIALADAESWNITIDDNRLPGGGWLYASSKSGDITHNRISGDGGLVVQVPATLDPLRVSDNRVPWMVVERSNVEIARNIIRPPDTRRIGMRLNNNSPGGVRGRMVVRDNNIAGAGFGMTYSAASIRSSRAVILGNTVSDCSEVGIRINFATQVEVTENEVTRCGSNAAGFGMQIYGAITEEVVVVSNHVHHISGAGIRVRPAYETGRVVLEANEIHDNEADGVQIISDAGVQPSSAPNPVPEYDPSRPIEEQVQAQLQDASNEPEQPSGGDPGQTVEPVLLDENQIYNNARHGVYALPNGRAELFDGTINNNTEAGVFVDVDARVAVAAVAFTSNGGPGIDIVPAGVSPNDQTKFANEDIDWPHTLRMDPIRQRLVGDAAPGARVNVYGVEGGDRIGNPDNGEGLVWLGGVEAGPAGRFLFPADGPLDCGDAELLTTTATLGGLTARTSEFSDNLACVYPNPDEADTDLDGVVDSIDQCPDTPPGTDVDERGCEVTENSPPVIEGSVPGNVNIGRPVTLDASDSSDPDGDALVFFWQIETAPPGNTGEIQNADQAVASFTPDVAGDYVIYLTVTDVSHEIREIYVVTVSPDEPNNPPVISATVPTTGEVGEPLVVDASASSDPDGDALTFFWTVTDEPEGGNGTFDSPNAPVTNLNVASVGIYTVEVAVSDGVTEVRRLYFITYQSPNHAPSANIMVDTNATVDTPIVLDGSGSSDPDSETLTYFWQNTVAPEGSTAVVDSPSAAQTSFTPDVAGSYEFELRVSDGELEDTAQVVIRAGREVVLSFATITCYDDEACTFAVDESSGSCTDCDAVYNDGTVQSCSADPDGASLPQLVMGIMPQQLSGTNCTELSGAALSFDCSGATCSHVNDGPAVCEGPGDRCEITSDFESLNGLRCEPAQRCRQSVTISVLTGQTVDTTLVSVDKVSVGGDGVFDFTAQVAGAAEPVLWTVLTEQGTGDFRANLVFGNEPEVTITETADPVWEAASHCVNTPANEIVMTGGDVQLSSFNFDSIWACTFTNTAQIDSDGDGIPDIGDHCPHAAGDDGNECPEQGDNGTVAYWCDEPLNCSFTATDGNCSDCVIEFLDLSRSISCAAGEVCVQRDSDVLQCPSGGCSYATSNFSGSCGVGSLCTLDDGFDCASSSGTGCDVEFDNGETLGCGGEACEVHISSSLLDPALGATELAQVEYLKTTEGAATGRFHFDLIITQSDGLQDDREFAIDVENFVGTTKYVVIVPAGLERISVDEDPQAPWALDRIACTNPPVVFEDPVNDQVSFVPQESNTCTFVNVREAAQPTRVEPIPDGYTAPEGVSNVLPNSFGGQLNTTNPVVAIANGSSEVFVDVMTGEVAFAGSERLSFTGVGPSLDVVVQFNEDQPGADAIRTAGQDTVTYNFDPVSGTVGFGILGFDYVIDLVHLAGNRTGEALLSVNRTRNRVDVLSPPASTGVDSLNSFQVVRSETLQNASGPVISAQAQELGRLDCNHPCRESGLPMPSGCSAEIDEILAMTEFQCDVSWGRTCATLYSQENDNFCSLPVDERQVNFGGHVLVLTDGTPGQLVIGNPAHDFFGRAALVAEVGDDPRRLRCLDGVCAVTNFGSDSLSIVVWDGMANANVTATVPVGDGPVGVSTRRIGNTVVMLTTGTNDNTYTKTTVALDGVVLSNETQPIPAGCEGPGHITWVDGSDVAVATCSANDSYAVFTP